MAVAWLSCLYFVVGHRDMDERRLPIPPDSGPDMIPLPRHGRIVAWVNDRLPVPPGPGLDRVVHPPPALRSGVVLHRGRVEAGMNNRRRALPIRCVDMKNSRVLALHNMVPLQERVNQLRGDVL